MAVTETTHRLVHHEVAHAVLAHMLGLKVVSISRTAPLDSGETCSVFREDDRRSLKERAFAWAVISIGAVWYEGGLVNGKALFCADSDVIKANMLAEAGGFTVHDASEFARDLCESEQFRTLHRRVSDALLHKVHLDERELARLLKT
jgi:hypothetical protein